MAVPLVTSLSIDPNTGELRIVSKENENGSLSFDVVATVNDKSDEKNIVVVINPVADSVTATLGSDATVSPNTLITLNSSASTDIDGDASYSWSLTKPATSGATLSSTTTQNPTFTPDVTGTYTATLTMSNGAGSSSDSVVYTVLPTLSVSDKTVSEGSNVVFRLNLSHISATDVTMQIDTLDGTAQQYKDYNPISQVVTIPAGESYVEVEIPVIIDQLPEASEYFYIKITDQNGVIVNDDTAKCNISYQSLNMSNLTGDNGFRILHQSLNFNDYYDASDATIDPSYYHYFPKNIAGIGDFDEDGFDDFVYGLHEDSSKGSINYIRGKKKLSEDGEFDLSDTSLVTTVEGENQGDHFGSSIGGIGDFNGDGYPDVIVGAPGYGSNTGRAYIYLTAAMGAKVTITGFDTGRQTGYSVDFAGDGNGDGYDDVIVGTGYGDGTSKGYSFIIYGKSISIDTTIDTSSLGINGITISSTTSTNESAGYVVSKAGDVNGDGYDDIIIGAPYGKGHDDEGEHSNGGRAFVIFGKSILSDISLDSLSSSDGVLLKGHVGSYGYNSYTGYDVSNAGDVNGDGYDDVLVTTADAVNYGVYLIYGKSDLSNIDLKGDSSSDYATFFSNGEGVFFSFDDWDRYLKASSIGDFNGDGYDDILIGSSSSEVGSYSNVGKAFVIYGGEDLGTNGKFLVESDTTNYLNGANGFTIEGINNTDLTGSAVSGVGDINGDGFKDLAVVAPNADGENSANAGAVYIIYGGAFNLSNVITGSEAEDTINGTNGDETIISGAKSDIIYGNGGIDSIRSGEGNDIIYVSDLDFKSIDGGNGFDVLKFDMQ